MPCNRRLDASYDFKCQVQNSDEKLRQFLKLKSDDSVTSTSIVSAIIADVISSVISSEKENTQKEDVCPTNFCPDNFNFGKDDTSYCSNSNKPLFCYERELQDQLTNTEQKKETEHVNIYKNLLEVPKRQIDSGKQEDEELHLFNQHIAQSRSVKRNKESTLQAKVDTVEVLKTEQISEKTLKADSIQDDEEKPLTSRTSRLRCPQCIKSFRTKVALQRHAIVHKRITKLRYVCYICDKQYSSHEKVKEHIVTSHETHDKKEDVEDKKVSYNEEKEIVNLSDKRISVQVSVH